MSFKIAIEIDVPVEPPVDATHYIPEDDEFFACWVEDGYTMRVGKQTEWVADPHNDPSIQYAYKII